MRFCLILLILFSLSSFAAEPIVKGDPAPFNGVIFNSKEAQGLVASDKKLKSLEQLQIRLEDKIEIQQQRIDLLRGYVQDSRGISSLGKFTYFMIGAVSTGVMMYYSTKIVKNMSK